MLIPLPHQETAIKDTIRTLANHDRATVVMACGTGKTLLGLFVTERLNVRNILVLVPSLALLRQTLYEWLAGKSSDKFAYLCICSDATVQSSQNVDNDEYTFTPSDLDFPVGTSSSVVADFFSSTHYDGVRCVFSTYQSATVVANGVPDGFTFDIAVFDEAHKTASLSDSLFNYALDNQSIAIKKRLFLTATPRIHDVNVRTADGDAKVLYSMDNEVVYGPLAHRLSCSDAIEQGIICGYKVLISVVSSKDIPHDFIHKCGTAVDGDIVNIKQAAHQIAIQKAVDTFAVSKIITYHDSIAAAKSFTGEGPEGIGRHLDGFSVLHVNGSMKMSDREEQMAALKKPYKKALVSNSRCLTEGVDVPSVDMVAFVSPRRSTVDIIQASGRVMRRSCGKTMGYCQRSRENVVNAAL